MRARSNVGDRGRSLPERTWLRLCPVIIALGCIVGVGVLVGAVPASAANNGSFAITPADKTNSFQRTYFTPVLSPGVTSKDSVAVFNETTKPLTLDIYASDAFTTRKGGFAVQPNYKPKTKMGAWIHLPVSTITITARSGDIIPFTYDPPANVAPGDYAGAIMAEQTNGAVTGGGAVKVQSLQAVGSAVYGRIVGHLEPRLAVTQVSVALTRPIASQFGGAVGAKVTYSVTNTGNEILDPKATIKLSPLLGGGATHKVKLPQVLPGSTVTFSSTFNGVIPVGHLTATVTAHAMGATSSGSASAVVIPWGLVVLFVLVIGGWVYWRRRRRASEQPGDAESESGGDGAPAGGTDALAADIPVEVGAPDP